MHQNHSLITTPQLPLLCSTLFGHCPFSVSQPKTEVQVCSCSGFLFVNLRTCFSLSAGEHCPCGHEEFAPKTSMFLRERGVIPSHTAGFNQPNKFWSQPGIWHWFPLRSWKETGGTMRWVIVWLRKSPREKKIMSGGKESCMHSKWISAEVNSSNERRAYNLYILYLIVNVKQQKSLSISSFPSPRKSPEHSHPSTTKGVHDETEQFQHWERFWTWFRYSSPGGKLCVCEACFQGPAGSAGLSCSDRSEEPGR